MLLSKEAQSSFNEAKAIHNLNVSDSEAIGMITITLKDGASADELVSEFKAMLQEPFW